MNYLAHAVLAGDDPEWIAGAFLGDHVRGDRWREHPPARAAGIRFHRALDRTMDSHPAVAEARRGFGEARRYAGILIDIGFDHLLAADWDRRSPGPLSLDDFARRCLLLLRERWGILPRSLRRFLVYAERTDQLVAYRTPEGVDRALRGVASRLSRPGPLAAGWDALAERLAVVARAFEATWDGFLAQAPTLRASVDRETRELLAMGS